MEVPSNSTWVTLIEMSFRKWLITQVKTEMEQNSRLVACGVIILQRKSRKIKSLA
jgi:hypothetical protein